jgi:bacillopeptidase F
VSPHNTEKVIFSTIYGTETQGGKGVLRERPTWVILAITLAYLCLAAGFARALPVTTHLEAILDSKHSGEVVPVIVTLREKADLSRVAQAKSEGVSKRIHRQQLTETLRSVSDRSQIPLKTLLANRNVPKVRSLWIINGLAFSAPVHLIREVASQPEVERVSLDSTVKVPPVTPAAAAISEWNINAIQAPELWNSGYTGQGIVVANMDTGVDILHPDLAVSWRGGSNSWYDPNGEHTNPTDTNGHGTGTMGVIVGGSAGGTNIGVAPGAKWIAVKIFNDNDEATISVIHEGFQWLLDPDGNPSTDDAPDVVNNSWGLIDDFANQCVEEFAADIQALREAGIAVVFSAGNTGPSPSSSISPANYPNSFAVGAVDEAFNIAPFSSRGPSACDRRGFPEVVAPGVNIKTSDLTFGGVFPNAYRYVDGTSFSAPHVAGTMALLMSAFPGVTLGQLEEALKTTALDLGSTGHDNVYGYGLVDALAAFSSFNGTPSTRRMTTVTSHGALDGWIAESAEGSNIGGPVRDGWVKVGDDGQNRQRKGVVSFDTSKIPPSARILAATLRFTRKDVFGNPFSSLGDLSVDITKGTFNQKRLQKSDFEEPASAPHAAVLSDPGATGGISTGNLNNDGINAINKGGITQMRLYFSQPTDRDRAADLIIFHSGEAFHKKKRPTLRITYLP